MMFSFSWCFMWIFYQRSAFLVSVWRRCLSNTPWRQRWDIGVFHLDSMEKLHFIYQQQGRAAIQGGTWLWRNSARHGMFILNIFLLKTSILCRNYGEYLFNKHNIFLNALISIMVFFLRFQGSKVWIIVLNKANSPIYDDKQCYDNRNDDVGDELDNLK